MRKYLLLLLLIPVISLARTWEMNNQGGGKIVLSERTCPKYPKLYEMYAYQSDGSSITGCWAVIDGKVHVVYIDGTRFIYNAESFVEMKSY